MLPLGMPMVLRAWLSRIRNLFHHDAADRDFDREIEHHVAMLAARYSHRGLTSEEAWRAARLQFGSVTQMKESVHERRGVPWFEEFLRDGKYAVRQLRKNPGFTVVAIAVLALGIGANTTIFSLVDAVLVKPLPYSEANRLLWVGETLKGNSTDQVTLTPDFLEWRDRNQVFTGLAAFNMLTRTLTNVGEPIQLHTAKASASLLPILGMEPFLGRNFSRAEDQKGKDQVALVSYGLWRRTLGGRRDVLGHALILDDRAYTVIGVLPPAFFFPSPTPIDVVTPLGKNEEAEEKRGAGTTIVHDVIARLKPGINLNQARAEMQTLESGIAPPSFLSGLQMMVTVCSLQSRFNGVLRTPLLALLGAVGFLLLMACANLSNLLLSRAIAREREMAIRASLGASRSRLLKQLLIESVTLAFLGGGTGALLAFCARGLLIRLLPRSIPGLTALSIDWRILSFTLAVACISALLFGLGPAAVCSASPVTESLSMEGRYVFGRSRRQLWLNGLASTQIAIAIVLLCGAGLMLRSFWNLRYRDVGFQTQHLLTAELHLEKASYSDLATQIRFLTKFLDTVSALPGVEGVAVGNLPPGDGHATNGFGIEGRSPMPEGQKPVARAYAISPSYFHLLQVPILRGRGFSDNDRMGALPVALVNQTFVRRNFPGQEALGRRLRLERDNPWSTIVGVVADVKTAGLSSPPEPVIYFPDSQVGSLNGDIGLLLRTALNSAYLEPDLRNQIARLDSRQPIMGIQTMDRRLNDSVAKPRLATVLLGCFGGIGLVLAMVGLYGVMALLVRGRFHEIGIRMAVGAQPNDVLRMVLMRSIQIVTIGTAAGIGCAFFLTRFIQSLLYDVSASDPYTMAVVIVFLSIVALAASYLPARAASRIDPMSTLRG
jgi:putative ABC transport system permease protein